MTNIHTWKTTAGVAVEKIAVLLAEIFADAEKAYKAVPGGADLTDINTGHMIERVTQVFGIKGLGWNLRWAPEDLVFIGDLAGASARCTAHLKNAVFSYCLVDEAGNSHWVEIQTSGMNTNSALYAEEGARTSALGAALKGLCFQLPIYKGYLDHHNAQAVATQMAAQRAAAAKKAEREGAAAETKAPATATPPADEKSIASPAPAAHAPGKNGASRPANGSGHTVVTAEAKPAAVPAATAAAALEAPAAADGDAIPDRLPDGVDVVKFIDGLADKIDLEAFVLPPGSNVSGQKLAAQNDARLRWYAYSMRGTNPRAMVLKVLAYRLLQRKNLLKDGDTHPLAG